ncbi:copper chaperone PCu(A)C [Brevibacterium litoralis]|uniref:copper chaperone PCu(A)C n=1 Tax=Brevibacterium litoralis TaxID=3138935 RepID=UPI0032EB86F1
MTYRIITARAYRPVLLAGVGALALGLSACGASAAEAPTPLESSATTAAASGEGPADGADGTDGAGQVLRLADGWLKATGEDEDGGPAGSMTGAFGTLQNTGDEDVTLTGASSAVADMVELHETENTGGAAQMKEKDGGFVVPAGGEVEFAPGGDHIMLMEITEPILPGDVVAVTLETDSGQIAVEFPAKDYAGARESYAPDSSAGADDEDEHADHDQDH